jgi:hypothetical protein
MRIASAAAATVPRFGCGFVVVDKGCSVCGGGRAPGGRANYAAAAQGNYAYNIV